MGTEDDNEAVLLALKDGPLRFSDISVGIDCRSKDRALQRLRRAGKIVFDSKTGWRVKS